MEYKALDIYDDMPSSMKRYISNYGWHFNKKAYEYAVKYMKRLDNATNMKIKVVPYTKQEVDNILTNHNVYVSNKIMYDYVYVATMCKADYLGSSIKDENHLALYIKDTIDDTLISVNGFEYIEDKLDLKMETLNKENIAMTEDMCQNTYELAVENTKRDIKDVYYGLNWFQKLLWRILGLNRLWLNEK